MISIGTAELKNNLSKYLKRVRRGEIVLVRDRNHVIAKLTPASNTDRLGTEDARIVELENAGVLRPPLKVLSSKWLKQISSLELNLVDAVLAERDESEQ
ncbi:MAG: type II toxin-antitoxin system prevent-host-death family antitoxin [Deltaproteobacteria bacterium]|nr:type II toxin-antitoxin system prevent-host-death family antitoxin [Deltaproteobacteria bacterium]